MTENQSISHLYRITNCLQTILDLEPALEQMDLGDSLLKEFVLLKAFLKNIENVDLNEDDVERIERATATFLDELKGPMSYEPEEPVRPGHVLQ